MLATRFVVEGLADKTSAAVVRGEVKLANGGGDLVLHAGEQAVAEPGRPPVRGLALPLSHLVSWAQQARHAEEHDIASHHGTLFARDPGVRSHPPWGQEYPLPIAKLGLDITVEDQVARVALDQTFHNDAPQDLEGMYRFAILPDAALQRLAMYVDGKLTESAVVERMRARRIYEEPSCIAASIRRCSNGLASGPPVAARLSAEGARGQAADARVHAEPAEAVRRLHDHGAATGRRSSGRRDGHRSAAQGLRELRGPIDESHDHDRAQKATTPWSRTTTRTRSSAISFVLHVRDTRHRKAIVATAERRRRQVRARALAGHARRAKRPGVQAADVADPRRRLGISRDKAELHAHARRDRSDGRRARRERQGRRDRVRRASAAEAGAHARDGCRSQGAASAAVEHEGGVGATDFEAALAEATKQLAGVDPDSAMIVYLGDGMITSGARNLDALRTELAGKAHFVGVGIGDGPDTQTLDALAAATGGYATTMDLADDLSWRAFDLVAALHTARVTGLEAKLVDGNGALVPATAYLGSPQLADGEELELVAKLASDHKAAAVELTGTLEGAPWQQRIALEATNTNAGYLPRMWAQRHIAARLLAKQEAVAMTPCMQTRSGAPCPSESGSARGARRGDPAARSSGSASGTSCCRGTRRCSCSRTTRCTASTTCKKAPAIRGHRTRCRRRFRSSTPCSRRCTSRSTPRSHVRCRSLHELRLRTTADLGRAAARSRDRWCSRIGFAASMVVVVGSLPASS